MYEKKEKKNCFILKKKKKALRLILVILSFCPHPCHLDTPSIIYP